MLITRADWSELSSDSSSNTEDEFIDKSDFFIHMLFALKLTAGLFTIYMWHEYLNYKLLLTSDYI